MKKIILTITAIAAASGYYYHNTPSSQESAESLLALVPADTIVLAYEKEGVNHFEYVRALGMVSGVRPQDVFAGSELTPEQNFLLNALNLNANNWSSAEELKLALGTGDTIKPLIYTIGAVPVYKLPIENPEALWRTLDLLELENGAKHELLEINSVQYRRYNLGRVPELQEDIGLVISTSDNILTITIDIPALGEANTVGMALGITKPESSILDSGKLETLEAQYQSQNVSSFGFINHQEIVTGLTTKDKNTMAAQMDILGGQALMEQLRSPSCHDEMTKIAKNWPQTVLYGNFTVNDNVAHMRSGLFIESKNQVVMDALNSMEGVFKSTPMQTDSFFSIALALDMQQLAPSIGNIWTELSAPHYQCNVLSTFQAMLGDQNPAPALQPGTSMINSITGIGATMFDLDTMSNKQGGSDLQKLDGEIYITSSSPQALINTAQMMIPELVNMPQLTNGQPLKLNDYIEDVGPFDVFVQKSKQGLSFYSGKTATKENENLTSAPFTENGLFSFTVDFNKFRGIIEKNNEPIPEELKSILQNKSAVAFTIGTNQDGIELEFNQHTLTQ